MFLASSPTSMFFVLETLYWLVIEYCRLGASLADSEIRYLYRFARYSQNQWVEPLERYWLDAVEVY